MARTNAGVTSITETNNGKVIFAGEGTALTAPANVQASSAGATSLTVTWNAAANAGGYAVQYATDAGFTTGVGSKTVNSSILSTDITGLNPNTLYYVRVKATVVKHARHKRIGIDQSVKIRLRYKPKPA
jgi:hypothetical protein